MFGYKSALPLLNLLCLMVLIGGLEITANSQPVGNCAGCAVPGGLIKGRVLNSRGGVVRGIEIYADRLDQEKGMVPTAEADDDGFFQLVAPEGQYAVYAGNQSLGYPESYNGIYFDTVKPVKVTVARDQVIEVMIRLGPRLRTLSGRIVDSSNGGYVKDANFGISLVEDPTRSLGTAPDLRGRFSVLSPSAHFKLTVQAPGYETKEIFLRPNSSQKILVPLKRVAMSGIYLRKRPECGKRIWPSTFDLTIDSKACLCAPVVHALHRLRS